MGKPRESQSLRNFQRKGRGNGLTSLTQDPEIFRSRQIKPREFEPRNDKQKLYASSMRSNILTFGVGPAGTGKTYVASAVGADMLMNKDVERFIVTRPAVEAGEELGFLPGSDQEKIAPYFRPFRDALEKQLGSGHVEALIRSGRIEFLPLAHMRGHSLENAFVVLDEAQNTTPVQMKMLLTRLGEGSRLVVDGDLSQKDIPGLSGLADALDKLKGMRATKIVRFRREDVVRSGFVQDVVDRYAHAMTEEEEDQIYLNLDISIS